ncbi:CDP-diacylglycerol diphosphatase [Enterovirga aerilata]|uniref:CDP-diacylglycerol pyrophosphatase n=1 Tax=Enterovirga aerilata TaxID=2730920 RepID=A0A849ICT6_9HYPH|nr:CDP-diacylglycerol diphosphatase [Enterovirga sp. DB1703]NNM74055.1 CDP-diacylglycerol diphosphatase [Enterovirga sp. DB1703]
MRRAAILLSLGLGLLAFGAAALPLPRDALWLVVRSCIVAQNTIGSPFPCLKVDAGRGAEPGYAIVRAPDRSTHIIVTPLVHIAGVESPKVLRDGAGAYWRAAFAARRYVIESAGGRIGESAVGLALNSMDTRSQDQLHIHAECFRPDVMAALRADRVPPGSGWHPVRAVIDRERYLARAVSRDDLASGNLFEVVATLPGAGGDLSRSKVLLVEAGDHFILAATRSSRRSIENLLDHGCSRTLKQG